MESSWYKRKLEKICLKTAGQLNKASVVAARITLQTFKGVNGARAFERVPKAWRLPIADRHVVVDAWDAVRLLDPPARWQWRSYTHVGRSIRAHTVFTHTSCLAHVQHNAGRATLKTCRRKVHSYTVGLVQGSKISRYFQKIDIFKILPLCNFK